MKFFNSLTHIIVSIVTAISGIFSPSAARTAEQPPSPTPTPAVSEVRFIETYSEYRYPAPVPGGYYELKVSLKIPEDGGAVDGSIRGTCTGGIQGSYNGQEDMNGALQGVCKILDPILSVDGAGSWWGKINKREGNLTLNYRGSAGGYSREGEITMTFQPVE